MASSRIEELKRQKKMEVSKKRNQIPYAILLTIAVLIIYLIITKYQITFGNYWVIGILLGITIQRSRFCFVASVRDPIMVGSTSLLKAILLAFIISTIGFFIIQYNAIASNPDIRIQEIPGQFSPVGIHTAIGAVLFGIGMVMAGGCVSGTLTRLGEGYAINLVVLVGFIIGSILGTKHFSFWDKLLISNAEAIYIPEYLGLFPTLILQLALLCVLYYIAHWYDKKSNIMASTM
ncbi:YeeE/YedE family protein [Alkaliphilus peptidifermentans]|uniref:Uncharacterized protein n=1 Tax=Alkaliphilus peptidifermentans DSM 18978 TaxID=1120976 RepID=A0A1G5EY29_9FIRM|nr:YeeE/YedE family protein [Alkaliphilus peptidifermentans]SCY31550.1 hypothetical protein SAMN03080606_01256 [Alkaliphilus peptidifermentans DSM 18978]